jgi:hypothetical protein
MNNDTPTSIISSNVFRSGRCSFRLLSENPKLLELFSSIFTAVSSDNDCHRDSLNIILEGRPKTCLRKIANEVMRGHEGHIYLESTVLQDPQGRLLLLAGGTRMGKSTLAVALLTRPNWKLVSEDHAFLDNDVTRLLTLLLPIRLRRGSVPLISAAVTHGLPKLFLGGYFYDRARCVESEIVKARFDACILLRGEPGSSDFRFSELDPFAFSRALLSLSNALHFDGGPDALFAAISNGRCWELAGGSLNERLAAVDKAWPEND